MERFDPTCNPELCPETLRGVLEISDARFRPIIGTRSALHPTQTELYKSCGEKYGQTRGCRPTYITYAENTPSGTLQYGVYRDGRFTHWTCVDNICTPNMLSLEADDF
jgi:hypothetical protein